MSTAPALVFFTAFDTALVTICKDKHVARGRDEATWGDAWASRQSHKIDATWPMRSPSTVTGCTTVEEVCMRTGTVAMPSIGATQRSTSCGTFVGPTDSCICPRCSWPKSSTSFKMVAIWLADRSMYPTSALIGRSATSMATPSSRPCRTQARRKPQHRSNSARPTGTRPTRDPATKENNNERKTKTTHTKKKERTAHQDAVQGVAKFVAHVSHDVLEGRCLCLSPFTLDNGLHLAALRVTALHLR